MIEIRIGSEQDIQMLAGHNLALALESEDINLDLEVVTLGVKKVIENDSLGFYLIAEFDGQPAGNLLITKEWSDWRNGMFWWIQSVYVKPEYRRQGIYRSLYKHVKQLSEQDPEIKGFRLYVEKENLPALQTYKNLGMEETYYRLFEELI